jgi:uncharacterized damage-inducible protein DinB
MSSTVNARLPVPHSLLVLNTRLLLNWLDGLDNETAQKRIDDRTNSAAFLGAHLVDSRFFFARALGALAVSPFALDCARTIDEVVALPSLADIRREWTRSAELLDERFAALTEAELSAPAPHQFPVSDPSLLGMIAFMVQHDSYHVGQLALLRKYYGLPAMRYA